jgi:2-methylfumaryl-CoA hydratase
VTKTNSGNFFEDFAVGQTIRHATPRTVTRGDAALYQALYGNRFAVQSSAAFARALGYPDAPLDDLLVFHVVFGKTVPDVSLNAIANLGYAGCRFLAPVYPGDTLSTVSEVIGLKENSNGKTGVVYVRSTGYRDDGAEVLDYARWVMVRKRDERSPAPEPVVPTLPEHLPADALGNSVPLLDVSAWDEALSGSPYRWGDYAVGERIDHVDGTTIEEAEHQMACRLFQNTAKVHFNQYTEGKGRFGRRLVYGGHVISTARALTFNGLGNAFAVAGINGGRHVNPSFAGDTIFAWSEILDKQPIHGRDDVGALRVRLVATKDRPCDDFPDRDAAGAPDPSVVLDLDWWLLMPR